jgi:type III pantothenate kinase
VDGKRNYIGGAILPGAYTALNALVEHTAQLPMISLEAPKKVIGKNTIDCMKSGIVYANAACLDGMIERIEKELGSDAVIVATGGVAACVVPHCKKKIILDDGLLLKGLKLIYDKNK